MNVRRNRKTEGPQTDRQGSVHCYCDGRVTQPQVLVPDMGRERGGTDQPGHESPRDSHPIGRNPGQSTECQADDKVHHAEEYHRTAPTLLT
jgi:hypothetical protein